ncbi:MAG: aspartate aminotransferase family protein [Pseudomonadales bacterium]|nr:aspartate aminotransferase family protein [Pseudomonadales bacterium]MCP5330962.1 aspartate aminotransferase family protein [Pseudomonadales bacterium]MCP5344592.1 aspartate aminotransferase family protein [Pseudomonadales bacterium]
MNTLESEDSFGLTVCHKFPVAIERGQGSVVWDVNGKAYLDFTSGWGVTSLGHAHPVVLNALNAQAARIMQNPNSGFTYSPVRARLLNRLQQVLPGDLCRVFFANSGAEANDGAVKLARKVTGRTTVIAISGSFHGRTLGTLSLSGGQENAARYLPQVPGNLFAPFGDMAALESLMSDQVAAVILEPVQGEGGVREQAAEYAQAVAALCQQYGALLIADEVQTGFCRTGSFFAVDALGIAPDILTMGKGIASGFPFAAFALTEAVAAGVAKGDHGGTYCGNPLGCAVADAVLEFLLENDIAAEVARKGGILHAGLQQLQQAYPDMVREIRGRGLLFGLQMASDEQVMALTGICLEAGLMVTPTRNAVLRLIPGLLVSEAEIAQALGLLHDALAHLQGQHRDAA